MLRKLAPIGLVLSLFITHAAHAAILFTPSISYLQQSLTDNANPQITAKLTMIDIRLGYVTDFGMYIGGMYSLHDQKTLADSSDSYFGPSVGYYNSGFLVVGTYFVYGERDLTNGLTKYAGVNGYQVDVSYSVPVTSTLRIGPQLTYHNIKFDEAQNSGVSSPTDYSLTGLVPYFNFTFVF